MPHSRPHLVITAPYNDWDMRAFEADYEVTRLWLADDPLATLAGLGRSVRAVAATAGRGIGAEGMDLLPDLGIISVFGVGYDAVDVAAARARGIAVTNTPDVLTGDVADMALALSLATVRRIVAGDRHVRSGAWTDGPMPLVTRMFGKKVGILGLGRIGEAIARRFAAFDCPIAYCNRSRKAGFPFAYFSDPVELARWADILVVVVPGGEATRGIVGREVLAALGPEGYLVNVSRGSTVDETALIDALENRRIAGAGLDVFLNEPAIDPRFAGFDSVVLQPHAASATLETRRAMGQLVRDNLAAFFAGTPLLTPV